MQGIYDRFEALGAYDFFAGLLNRSLAAGIIVAAVVVLRLLLRRTPRKYFCALWGVAAVRLALPLHIKSPLSAFQFLGQRAGGAQTFHFTGAGVKPMVDMVIPSPAVGGAALVRDTHYLPPIFTLWLLGAAVMVGFAVVSYCFLRKEVRASVEVDGGVRLCDDIQAPFILGVLRPRIYLPSGMEEETKSCVLAHERMHLRRLDHVWKPLGFLLLALHWFNPLLWLGYALFCRDIESACDEAVVRGMDAQGRGAYSQALLSCAVKKRFVSVCPLSFGEVGVKERVKHVMNYKKPAFWLVIVAVAACIVAAVCFLTDPVEKEPSLPAGDGQEADSDFSSVFSADYYGEWISHGYAPWYMQPDTEILVDENLRCTIEKGGSLTLADIEKRKDLQDMLSEIMYDPAGEDNVPLEPRTKLSYDLHGLLSHVYYENLNNPGEYNLDPASSGRTDITGGA